MPITLCYKFVQCALPVLEATTILTVTVMSIVVLILCVAEGEEVLAGVGMNAVPIMY